MDPMGGMGIPAVVQLPRNQVMQRPPESDEMRKGMPRASVKVAIGEDGEEIEVYPSLTEGPKHIGMRRYAGIKKDVPLDEQLHPVAVAAEE